MNLYDKSSLILVPSGVKASKVYSQRPENGDGDFTFTRASGASRVNEDGILEQVASNVPRLDYTNSSCPSLLLEPQRTNQVTYSEDFSGYSSIYGVTLTPNAAISPDGTQNATKLEGVAAWGVRDIVSSTINVESTISVYVKAVNPSANNTFRLTTGGNILSSDLTATDQWQRFEFTATSTGGSLCGFLRDSLSNDADLYIWGMQVELASYATSYIPTYGTVVTRNEDSLGTLTNYGIFGQDSGTLFYEFKNNLATSNNWGYITSSLGGYFRFRSFAQFTVSSATFSPDGNLGYIYGHKKICVVYGNGVAKLFTDGVENAEITYTGTIKLDGNIQNIDGGYNFANNEAHIEQIIYFPTALTDEEAIALTTL